MSIHTELAALSGQNPAGYVTTEPLARVTLRRLLTSAEAMKGKIIPAGTGKLSATLREIAWASKPAASLVPPRTASPDPTLSGREVDVLITSPFDVVVEISIAGHPSKVISEVVLSYSDARTHLRAEQNTLILEGADFDVKRKITRRPDADTLLNAAGIDLLEAARIEGHIGYGVISQAVTQALAQRTEVSLGSLFPAVDFGTAIGFAVLGGGDALGIIPREDVQLDPGSRCACADGADLQVGTSSTTVTAPPNPGPNDEIGQIRIGGPVPDNKDPLRDFGRRYSDRDGIAGLYIPQRFAEALVLDVMPSIKVVASDRGAVGYRAEANVGFKNLRVSFDQAGGGILLDIELDISISAYCDAELYKGIRAPIGWAIVLPAQGSSARVQLGFYPSIDSSGTVRLKSTLRKADMGSYVAVVIGIGSALKLFGVTWWIGYLVDVVLATILSRSLPIALKKAIGKHLAGREWKLIEGLSLADPIPAWPWAALFDVSASSILVSFEARG